MPSAGSCRADSESDSAAGGVVAWIERGVLFPFSQPVLSGDIQTPDGVGAACI